MGIRRGIWLATLAVAALLLALLLYRHSRTEGPRAALVAASSPPASIPQKPQRTTNPAEPVSSELESNYLQYRQGLISKEQVKNDVQKDKNRQTQDFYGRIIDQYGQPVVGAEVTGNLEVIGGQGDNAKSGTYKTQSDSGGLFQFTGLIGWQLGVTVSKPGYEMGARGEGFASPLGGQSTPTDPATFTMWRLRGADPMVHAGIESRIPYDGTSATFDLRTGAKSDSGDLRLTLVRSPQQVPPGLLRPYDWQLKVELMNGGIEPESDPYPYWAPDSGYQPAFGVAVSSNDVPWNAEFAGKFYFKNAQGQYGRLTIDLSTSSKRPDTGVSIESWINPSGSQNLEYDPAKQAP